MLAKTIAALVAASPLCFAMAGCAVDSDNSASTDVSMLDSVTCTQDAMIHIRADTYFPRPDHYEGSVRFNGCWRFERPTQARWGKCDTSVPNIKREPETGPTSFTPARGQGLDEALAEFERAHINRVLERNRFSLTRAAEQLKISRHALRYRMQRLNINLDDYPDDAAAPDTPAAPRA